MLSQTTLFKSDIRPTNHIFKADRPIVDLLDQQTVRLPLSWFSSVGWVGPDSFLISPTPTYLPIRLMLHWYVQRVVVAF